MVNRANAALRIRTELLARDLPVPEIAAEIGRQLNERPRVAWRRAMGWSQAALVERYKAVNPGARLSVSRISEYESWPYGGAQPPLTYLTGLAFTLGCAVTDLIDTADREHFEDADRHWLAQISSPETSAADHVEDADEVPEAEVDQRHAALASVLAPPRVPRPGTDRPVGAWQAGPYISDIMNVVAAQAAHETWRHLASITVSIEPMGIQMVQDQLIGLSRNYAATAPAAMLLRARQVRDTTFEMLEQTKRPSQLVDLHLAAGMSCALLASASFDLGHSDAAQAQIRAADRYADMAGHPSLQAWAVGFAGLLAYWDGRPAEALQIVQEAIPQAPAGTATARLESIRARAYALMDDRRQVAEALAAADGALGAGQPDELHDTVGGELGWERERHDMCAGTALVAVGDARGAADRLGSAVEHAGTTSFVDPARADLAAARLLDRDLEGAVDALEPVWSVSVERRRYGFTSRLAKIDSRLQAQEWADHAPARSLHDQVATFVSEADEHRALLAAGSID